MTGNWQKRSGNVRKSCRKIYKKSARAGKKWGDKVLTTQRVVNAGGDWALFSGFKGKQFERGIICYNANRYNVV